MLFRLFVHSSYLLNNYFKIKIKKSNNDFIQLNTFNNENTNLLWIKRLKNKFIHIFTFLTLNIKFFKKSGKIIYNFIVPRLFVLNFF